LMVLNGEISPPNVPMERPAFVWPVMPSSFKHGEDSSRQWKSHSILST
jgi:hypothetical protein